MATVPVRQAQQVQSISTPNVSVSGSAPLEAFGGGRVAEGPNQATQKLVEDGISYFSAEKQKADDLAVKNAWGQLSRTKNDLIYNPDSGAMNKKGQDAFGVIDEYEPQFQKSAQEIEDSLHNDDQKAMFRQIRARQNQEFTDVLQKHTFQETKRYEEEVTQNGVANARNDAVLNYQTPGKVDESIELQKVFLTSYAADNGLSAEWVKAQTEKAVSQTNTAVLNRMLANGQDLEAEAFYKEKKDQFTSDDIVQVEKSIQEGSSRGAAFRMVDDFTRRGLSLSQGYAEIRNIENPKVREAVTDRWREENVLKEQAKRENEERIFLNATNLIDGGGTFNSIPPAEVAKMPLSMRNSLREYSKNKIENKYVATNPAVYQRLKTMIADPATRSQAIQYNLLQHQNEIDSSDLKQLINEQAGLRKNDPNITKQLDGYMSDSQVVETALQRAGINPKSDQGLIAKDAVDKRVQQFATKTGKKASNEDIRRITNEQLFEVITDRGFLWDSKKRLFEVEPGQEFEVDVPQADRDQIVEALRKKGLAPSESNIMNLYIRGNSGQ